MRQYHGLNFVTSSLEKKAEAIAVKAKLDKDSTHLQEEDGLATLESNSQKRSPKLYSSVAYEIAASAACHVQYRAKNESRASVRGNGDYVGEKVCPVPKGCKSEMAAAQMAASTMTAVVAAREREKQEAAKELQSLHSSPCEWFICDDPTTRVRHFVIQVNQSFPFLPTSNSKTLHV